ncbi:hypothetical protein JR316_0002951 [Psilocybe cubensis]|nr:hypothetical protein JR316_0002951 [Psilocybe cubensis]KAH9483483.1 hypothetical protein JR316_0002951 [Psilocybe cubensis]
MAIKDRSVMVVDTPGFDDTCTEDVQVLRKIATWLKKSYEERKTVAGVLYLHDISQDRFTGSVRKNLELFRRLCGREAFSQVVIVMTKGEKLHPQIASKYEYELRSEHWRDLIDAGATVLGFKRNYRSARSIIDHVLRGLTRKFILQLQKELVIQKKLLPATEAGKHLKTTLQQVLALQSTVLDMTCAMATTEEENAGELEERLRELRDEMKILSEQITTLRDGSVPYSNTFFCCTRNLLHN